MADLLIQIVHIANRGVHGEIVDQRYIDFVNDVYPYVMRELNECLKQLRKNN